MEPMPVSWISTFLYCKRKLYLEQTRNLKVSNERYIVKEEIRHRIFNEINSVDEEIVKSIKSFKVLEEIEMIFRKRYYSLAHNIIKENDFKLAEIGLKVVDFFHEVWSGVLKEAQLRAKNLFVFISREKIYSDELWSKLVPKYLSEVSLESDKLKGVVDRIEIYPGSVVPIELKFGKGPKEGVWPGDRAQVESYMVLSSAEFGKKVDYGFVNYLESGELRKVPNNEFVPEFIDGLIENINNTLEGNLPDFVKNKNKCTRCPLKEKCYGVKE
jgi:CRISPR/Cas system-associated exonuclease Cas4 (RecB family)